MVYAEHAMSIATNMDPSLAAAASQVTVRRRQLSETLLLSTPSLSKAVPEKDMAAIKNNQREMEPNLSSSAPTNLGEEESPADFVARVFRAHGLETETLSVPFVAPTEEMIAAYRNETLKAARAGDVAELRQMLQRGESLDCCNRFGESLIHLACRRGNLELVRFLVLEAKVTLLIRDDYHRTVLHDSFWTPEPKLDLVDFLLDHVPLLLCAKDVRGHAPVDYIRQEHKMTWLNFLRQREHKLCPKSLATKSRESCHVGCTPREGIVTAA